MEGTFFINTFRGKWVLVGFGLFLLCPIFPEINVCFFIILGFTIICLPFFIIKNVVEVTISENGIKGTFHDFPYRKNTFEEISWAATKTWKLTHGKSIDTLTITSKDDKDHRITAISSKQFDEMLYCFQLNIQKYNNKVPNDKIEREPSFWGE
jgi:hypothetical protein